MYSQLRVNENLYVFSHVPRTMAIGEETNAVEMMPEIYRRHRYFLQPINIIVKLPTNKHFISLNNIIHNFIQLINVIII